MELNKTIIIPSDDSILAQQLFNSAIYDEDVLVLAIIGGDEKAIDIVRKADKLAQLVTQDRKRKVLWIRDKEIIRKEIEALKIGQGRNFSKKDIMEALAFSVSLGDEVMDIIRQNEYISFIRIDTCFSRAL
jgi:hypothetical protein